MKENFAKITIFYVKYVFIILKCHIKNPTRPCITKQKTRDGSSLKVIK